MRIALRKVHLARFKAAFKPGAVDLGDFNVVIGRNGSGKSTLVDALQWLDTAIRRDTREATEKFRSISDLINLRSQANPNYFELTLEWVPVEETPSVEAIHYTVRIEDADGNPHVAKEILQIISNGLRKTPISTRDSNRFMLSRGGHETVPFLDSDRLAIARLGDLHQGDEVADAVTDFWRDAVFLRLAPARLSQSSLVTRKSFEPLLDEEGAALATLLFDFSEEGLGEIADEIQRILPGIRGVELHRSGVGRSARGEYGLQEQMPYRGRTGKSRLEVPSWMLSEGTRRITALVALMTRDAPPSLLCVEEVENGLDPWAVKAMVARLQSAAFGGQIILTTHSPSLLNEVPLESILMVRRLGGDTQYAKFALMEEVSNFNSSLPAGTRYANLEDNPAEGL